MPLNNNYLLLQAKTSQSYYNKFLKLNQKGKHKSDRLLPANFVLRLWPEGEMVVAMFILRLVPLCASTELHHLQNLFNLYATTAFTTNGSNSNDNASSTTTSTNTANDLKKFQPAELLSQFLIECETSGEAFGEYLHLFKHVISDSDWKYRLVLNSNILYAIEAILLKEIKHLLTSSKAALIATVFKKLVYQRIKLVDEDISLSS